MKRFAWAVISPILFSATVNAGVYFSETQSSTNKEDSVMTRTGKSTGYNKLPAYDLIKGLAPENWIVNMGPGVANARLEWQPSPNWQSALLKIQDLNQGIYLAINDQDHVIAVAGKREHLEYLQTREPKLWTLDPKLSLKENLAEWNKKTNIEIVYDAPYDYPVLSRSVLVGDLAGVNGVLDRVLKASTNKEWPLAVDYAPEIPALRIVLGGAVRKTQ